MYITIYYVLIVIYTYLFSLLFNIGFTDYQEPRFYLLGILSILLSIILSFWTILLTFSWYGELRKGKPYDNKWNHFLAKDLLRLAMHLGRIKVVVSGEENIPEDNKFVFVANHQENLDIVILLPIFKNHPISFIAKKSLFEWPFVGKWIGILGNVEIGKEADREAAMSIINAIKRYKSGVPFGIFPEGKRSRSNDMIEFKPGAFKLAMKPQADILIGTVYDLPSVFKKFQLKKYKCFVHFHPVLKYEDYKHMNSIELSDHVKSIIQSKLDDFDNKQK